MKKIFYTMAITSFAMISLAKAQVSIGVSIGTPAPIYVAPAPVWVPVAQPASPYYYFPDINCYYDMGIGQYIYMENNGWRYSRGIPPRFAHYNFRGARMMPMSRAAFGYRGIPAYRGGGRPPMMNNNYSYRDRGGQPRFNNGGGWNNGRGGHDGQGRGGRWGR